MKRKYWWIFGAIQLLGLLSAIEGLLLLEDPVMFGLSLLLLLPGTLVSFPLSTLGHVVTHWLDRLPNRRDCERAPLRGSVFSRRQSPEIKMSERPNPHHGN